MKKNTLILIIFLTTGGNIFSQEAPSLAPLNPDFVNFMAKYKNGEYPLPGTDAFGTGGMPPPVKVSFDDYLKNNNLKSTAFAPVYDMRTTGLLTPVRLQTNGACWAFATIASVESRWLVLGLGAWDLSENNLKYCHGFDSITSTWGSHYMSTAYFARRSGPLVEADDPNKGGSTGPSKCPTGKIPVAYIADARYLPHDMNTIKQAILDQGAIYTMMYYIVAYYNASNYTYYYNGTPRVNHAVVLVGWDDTKVTNGGTGAWICKNSYGATWGEAGYFYVSYNDHSILDYNAYWPVRFDNVPSSQVYGYDDLGDFGSYGEKTPVGYILVKFIATGKQLLSKVGTYAMAAGTTLEIDVFDSFDPVSWIPSGLLSHQADLSCAMPGYYTFDLPAPITVEQGNDFYIRVRYQTPAYNYPIPVEYAISGYADPDIESNVSWISGTGANGSWFLIGNSTDYKWDPCVKVYAESFPTLLTWNGTISNDWNNAANWSPANVPDAAMDVIILNVARKPVVNQASATPAVCKNLTIDAGSSVTINSGKALTVYGTLTNNAGESGLVIKSNEYGTGSLLEYSTGVLATVERYMKTDCYHNFSPSVSGEFSGMFHLPASTDVDVYFYSHNEEDCGNSTHGYVEVTDLITALDKMKGYTVYPDKGSHSYAGWTFVEHGTLNTGSQSIGLTRKTTGGSSGWNLVGNPYPSSIDWDASGWTKTNLNNAIYIENSGRWATYISGAGTNGGTRYIAPGQGFFVSVAGVGSGSLAMNNYVRVHNATAFFKNSNASSLVRLEVSGNNYKDEAVVRFQPEATAEFDGDVDACKFFGDVAEAAQLYSLGSTPLSINTLPETSTVPMGMRVNTRGVFTIAATEVNDLSAISLEDIKTGTFTDLLKGSYSFGFTPGENEQRFVLHFGPLSVNKMQNSFADIYSNSRTVYVDLKDNVKGDIFIYTISGKLVATALAVKGINKIGLAGTGNYIVKVITIRNTMVKKVWIQ